MVTEYGIAELQGKGIYQRVMELAQIAHPKFREELIAAAKKHRYIFADQLPPSREDLLFLENYKSNLNVKSGKTIEFRPLLPSDEFSYRNFFYSLQEKTIYLRFFHNKRLFPHEIIQRQWSSIDYRRNISIVGLAQHSGHKEMIAIGSYAMDSVERAEVAFVVREDYQGMGIASYLLEVLEIIAKENGFQGFTATVLHENTPMIRVFKKRYPRLIKSQQEGGEIVLIMDFTPPAAETADSSP